MYPLLCARARQVTIDDDDDDDDDFIDPSLV